MTSEELVSITGEIGAIDGAPSIDATRGARVITGQRAIEGAPRARVDMILGQLGAIEGAPSIDATRGARVDMISGPPSIDATRGVRVCSARRATSTRLRGAVSVAIRLL